MTAQTAGRTELKTQTLLGLESSIGHSVQVHHILKHFNFVKIIIFCVIVVWAFFWLKHISLDCDYSDCIISKEIQYQ